MDLWTEATSAFSDGVSSARRDKEWDSISDTINKKIAAFKREAYKSTLSSAIANHTTFPGHLFKGPKDHPESCEWIEGYHDFPGGDSLTLQLFKELFCDVSLSPVPRISHETARPTSIIRRQGNSSRVLFRPVSDKKVLVYYEVDNRKVDLGFFDTAFQWPTRVSILVDDLIPMNEVTSNYSIDEEDFGDFVDASEKSSHAPDTDGTWSHVVDISTRQSGDGSLQTQYH